MHGPFTKPTVDTTLQRSPIALKIHHAWPGLCPSWSHLLGHFHTLTKLQLPWPSFLISNTPSLSLPLGPWVCQPLCPEYFALYLYRSTSCHVGFSSDITCSKRPHPLIQLPYPILLLTILFSSWRLSCVCVSKHDSYLLTPCLSSLLASKLCGSTTPCLFAMRSPSSHGTRVCPMNEWMMIK